MSGPSLLPVLTAPPRNLIHWLGWGRGEGSGVVGASAFPKSTSGRTRFDQRRSTDVRLFFDKYGTVL